MPYPCSQSHGLKLFTLTPQTWSSGGGVVTEHCRKMWGSVRLYSVKNSQLILSVSNTQFSLQLTKHKLLHALGSSESPEKVFLAASVDVKVMIVIIFRQFQSFACKLLGWSRGWWFIVFIILQQPNRNQKDHKHNCHRGRNEDNHFTIDCGHRCGENWEIFLTRAKYQWASETSEIIFITDWADGWIDSCGAILNLKIVFDHCTDVWKKFFLYNFSICFLSPQRAAQLHNFFWWGNFCFDLRFLGNLFKNWLLYLPFTYVFSALLQLRLVWSAHEECEFYSFVEVLR